MLQIALSVFGLLAVANGVQAQKQYSENIERSRVAIANSYRANSYSTNSYHPTSVKSANKSANILSSKPERKLESKPESKPERALPLINLPTVRPMQQPTPKTGTVLATISMNPKNERVPVNPPSSTISRTSERVSTQSRQGQDGRTTTKTTKTVTTVNPDGTQRVSTSYNTRVSMSSTPAKTTPARTNIAPVAPKTASNVPVTVTTAKSPFSTTSSNASSKTGVVAAPKTAPKSVAAKNIESATSFSDIQRSAANTGSTAAYLSPEEKKVLLLINLVRADGGTFLKEYVDKYIKTNLAFQNNTYAQSLYGDLKKVKGLPPLRPNMKLCNSARAHAQDIGQKGMKGHQSSNGMKFDTRVARYVGSYRGLGENISYGNNHNSAVSVVLELLIDNNNKDFGHRRNILSPSFESIGVSIQPHTKYGFTCVQDFGAGVE